MGRDARLQRNEHVVTRDLLGIVLRTIVGQKLVFESGLSLEQPKSDIGKDQLALFVEEIPRQSYSKAWFIAGHGAGSSTLPGGSTPFPLPVPSPGRWVGAKASR